jgi:hypothetical protein
MLDRICPNILEMVPINQHRDNHSNFLQCEIEIRCTFFALQMGRIRFYAVLDFIRIPMVWNEFR